MGKTDGEQLPSDGQDVERRPLEENACSRCGKCGWIGRKVRFRCVAALVLGLAVILSAVFWLPFLNGGGRRDRMGDRFGTDIVASFQLQKPTSMLASNISQLQHDIFEEIGVPNSSVSIISLEPLPAVNWTNVVFGVWAYPINSNLSSIGLSILRSTFVTLVTEPSTLRLTQSLFGNPFYFQVLGFPGGITIVPPQGGFPLEEPRMLFNFTLNFSINQVYGKISQLKNQLSSGLHLIDDFENLYFSLTNSRGSTVSPPTIVQTSILLAVGNHPPSKSRLKELAQSITPEGNLGLNNSVFGRVKQIRLSSFLQHSINGSTPPSSAPPPHSNHHHHHHHHHHETHHLHDDRKHHHHHHHPRHHHHHHHHYHRGYLPSSASAPAPAPSPQFSEAAVPPSGHQFGSSKKPKKGGSDVDPMASSPVPYVIFSQVTPPTENASPTKSPEMMQSSRATNRLNFVLLAVVPIFYMFVLL